MKTETYQEVHERRLRECKILEKAKEASTISFQQEVYIDDDGNFKISKVSIVLLRGKRAFRKELTKEDLELLKSAFEKMV